MKTSSIIFGLIAIVFSFAPYTVVQTVLALDCDCICLCNPIQIAPQHGGDHLPDNAQDRLDTIEDQVNHRIDQLNQRLAARLAPLPELPH